MGNFLDWFWEIENKKNRKEWEPIPLELPVDDPSMIMPPTTSSKDEESRNTDTFEDTTTVSFEL